MKCYYFYRWMIVIGLLTGATNYCMANDGVPEEAVHFRFKNVLPLISDTVPSIKSSPVVQKDTGAKGAAAIKEVPKARKQAAPVALPVAVKVKPANIIKPKIIKPVIKIK